MRGVSLCAISISRMTPLLSSLSFVCLLMIFFLLQILHASFSLPVGSCTLMCYNLILESNLICKVSKLFSFKCVPPVSSEIVLDTIGCLYSTEDSFCLFEIVCLSLSATAFRSCCVCSCLCLTVCVCRSFWLSVFVQSGKNTLPSWRYSDFRGLRVLVTTRNHFLELKWSCDCKPCPWLTTCGLLDVAVAHFLKRTRRN